MDKWIVTIFYKWTVLKETTLDILGKLSIQYIHVYISYNLFIFTYFFKISKMIRIEFRFDENAILQNITISESSIVG